MTLDRALLAEKTAAVQRHLDRVAEKLPPAATDLQPMTDASDATILHLWQATQIVIDVAMAACVELKLGTPSSYADAFQRLSDAGHLDVEIGGRLARAAGFRNVLVHAYGKLDMARVHEAATRGPADLRAFLGRMADHLT